MSGTAKTSEADELEEAPHTSLAIVGRKAEGLRYTLSKTQEALTHLHEVMLPDA